MSRISSAMSFAVIFGLAYGYKIIGSHDEREKSVQDTIDRFNQVQQQPSSNYEPETGGWELGEWELTYNPGGRARGSLLFRDNNTVTFLTPDWNQVEATYKYYRNEIRIHYFDDNNRKFELSLTPNQENTELQLVSIIPSRNDLQFGEISRNYYNSDNDNPVYTKIN